VIPRSRVHTNLIVFQLMRKYSVFCGTRRIDTVFARARSWSLPLATCTHQIHTPTSRVLTHSMLSNGLEKQHHSTLAFMRCSVRNSELHQLTWLNFIVVFFYPSRKCWDSISSSYDSLKFITDLYSLFSAT
jgi:hypothetical protein